jgi:hypothetical protein
VNVTFPTAGQYWIQTLVDSTLFEEQPLVISEASEPLPIGLSEAVN